MRRCILAAALTLVAASAVSSVRIERLDADIYRVRMDRAGAWPESLMNRYGVIEKLRPEEAASLPRGLALPEMRQSERGFSIRFPLTPDERVYGLGDVSRSNLNRRGGTYEMWVENINSYIPIPMAITSRGWGVLVNSTRRHVWDVGRTDPDALVVSADVGEVDFYLFRGRDYRALLDAYTRLTGRPKLLPVFAYGFSYVANQWLDSYETVAEAHEFRRYEFPCDVLGLEPGWMEAFYDSTTRKQWNKRLAVPFWLQGKGQDDRTWLGAIRRMGFKLSLWLCTRYDHFVYEEALANGTAKAMAAKAAQEKAIAGDGTFIDEHIDAGFIGVEKPKPVDVQKLSAELRHARREMQGRVDGLTGDKQSGEEPWFDHLAKFVDDGARCFKLDGAWQVADFKDRVWAGRISNAEAHNIYPIVYAKQMATGFENHTGKRAMVYSDGGYVGVQRYVATWAGDTGGGVKTLVSTLNLGASGHPSQTCDMEVNDLPSLHYGILAPWCQQNNWDYFQQPWYRSRKDLETIRNYVRLRYRLIPYVYTAAAGAARSGWPIARPLAFAYPDRPEYADECGTYLFGDSLLVSAFVPETTIPPGVWYEWRTGEKVVGPCRRPVVVGEGWGGGLYVKAGSIIPMWPEGLQCLDKGWNDKVELHVWPGADGAYDLYEDDGDTLGYLKGEAAVTHIDYIGGKVIVGETKGMFSGRPVASDRFSIVIENVRRQ